MLTLEGHVNTCVIQVYGKRSVKGWKVLKLSGASTERLGEAKHKDKAIRLAENATHENRGATIAVKPVE